MSNFTANYENYFQQILNNHSGIYPSECWESRKTSYGISKAGEAWLKTNLLTEEQAKRLAEYMKKIHAVCMMQIWGALNFQTKNLFLVHEFIRNDLTKAIIGPRKDQEELQEWMNCGCRPVVEPRSFRSLSAEKQQQMIHYWLMFNGFIDLE